MNSPPDEDEQADIDFGASLKRDSQNAGNFRPSLGSRASMESANARLSTHNRISYQVHIDSLLILYFCRASCAACQSTTLKSV